MAILSISKLQLVASSAPPNESSSPSLSRHPQLKQQPKPYYRKLKLKQEQQQQQPSVFEIERAIGAGIFRDRDIDREGEEKGRYLEKIVRNTIGKNEGAVEKKLRESGEWLIHRTEAASRSAGKQMVMTVFVLMIPLWMFSFLVASGLLHIPFLDDNVFF